MKIRSEVLVCYDIEDNKQRKKLHTALLDLGLKNVQKSVFWGHLNRAEQRLVSNLFKKYLSNFDRAFLTRSNINFKEDTIFGHRNEEFKDWEEYGCI